MKQITRWYADKPQGPAGTRARSFIGGAFAAAGAKRADVVCVSTTTMSNHGMTRPLGPPGDRTG